MQITELFMSSFSVFIGLYSIIENEPIPVQRSSRPFNLLPEGLFQYYISICVLVFQLKFDQGTSYAECLHGFVCSTYNVQGCRIFKPCVYGWKLKMSWIMLGSRVTYWTPFPVH
jgi:hypothetical protein